MRVGHTHLLVQGQGLAQHKARLGHGSLHAVHQQQHAVGHVEHALHLPWKAPIPNDSTDASLAAPPLTHTLLHTPRAGRDTDLKRFQPLPPDTRHSVPGMRGHRTETIPNDPKTTPALQPLPSHTSKVGVAGGVDDVNLDTLGAGGVQNKGVGGKRSANPDAPPHAHRPPSLLITL